MAAGTQRANVLTSETSLELSKSWRRFSRIATIVAVLTAPVAFTWYHRHNGWDIGWSLLATLFTIAAFRGVVDVILRKFIPWPTLFGVADSGLHEADVTNRRRAWFWRFWVRIVVFFL